MYTHVFDLSACIVSDVRSTDARDLRYARSAGRRASPLRTGKRTAPDGEENAAVLLKSIGTTRSMTAGDAVTVLRIASALHLLNVPKTEGFSNPVS